MSLRSVREKQAELDSIRWKYIIADGNVDNAFLARMTLLQTAVYTDTVDTERQAVYKECHQEFARMDLEELRQVAVAIWVTQSNRFMVGDVCLDININEHHVSIAKEVCVSRMREDRK